MLTLLLACTPDTEVPDRTSQSALETINRAPEIEATDESDTPEDLAVASGFELGGLRWWSHARAWIHADVSEVWAALRVHDVMVNRRILDAWSIEDEGHRPDVDHSYAFASEMSMPVGKLEFVVTWLHTVEDGDLEGPDLVVATWDVTTGPAFLDSLTGSIELEQIEPGLTELRGVYHLGVASQGPAPLNRFWEDLHAELHAVLAGEALPDLE